MRTIENISAREVLDCRGNPTVQADVLLSGGAFGTAIVPTGASMSTAEARELRDGGSRYLGKGVLKAVANVNHTISPMLTGLDASDLGALDKMMIEMDSTSNKQVLGANAILAVSLAMAKALANAEGMPLYKLIGGTGANVLPVPMMNIMSSTAKPSSNIDIREFMIMPVGAPNFTEGLRMCVEVIHSLARLLKTEGLSSAEGGAGQFTPNLSGDEAAIELILRSIVEACYIPGEDFVLAINAAASEWELPAGGYRQPKSGREFSTTALVSYWASLVSRYPIASLEDGLGNEDWDGWKLLTDTLGDRFQLIGNDLFVTNPSRLQKGIDLGCANAALIHPTQIGSLSETLATIALAHGAGYSSVISHRLGETEDTTIVDLCVATGAGQIKAGSPVRGEHVAKYNRLLRIEEELGDSALWPGKLCFD